MTSSVQAPAESACVRFEDHALRCRWSAGAPEFLHYHDTEWGFPVADDIRLFEKLSLEGFQSGLSWRTILAKRENFRKAFFGFDFKKIASLSEPEVQALIKACLQNSGIVRHRGKIEAVLNNARCAVEVATKFGSLAAYLWQFEPQVARSAVGKHQPSERPEPALPPVSSSNESIALSQALKKQGWKFVGPTTLYAFMQAMGMVNDHAGDCVIRARALRARDGFNPDFPLADAPPLVF